MTVTVAKATVRKNIYKNFYDLISAISGFSTITYPTFPEIVEDSEDDYPVVIIDPANVAWETFTFGKNVLNGTIDINVYTITQKDTDEKADSIDNKIETSKTTLAGVGLRNVMLDSESDDMIPHGKIRVYIKTLIFKYKFYSDKTFAF